MISILISVFNGAKDIHGTFQSVYNQTYTDWELIVVDDASTDSSLSLLNREKFYHPSKIQIFHNEENLGLTRSLIKAASQAKGDFLARLDIGDRYLPQKLEKQIEFFTQHADCGLLGCAYTNIDSDSGHEKLIQPPITDVNIRSAILRMNPFAHSAIMMRSSAYSKAGGYDPLVKYAQDYDLWFRILKICKAANLREMLCVRTINTHSISYGKQKSQMQQCLRIRWKYLKKWKLNQYGTLLEPFSIMLMPQYLKKILKKYFHFMQY